MSRLVIGELSGAPFSYVIDEIEGVIANAGFAGTLEQLEALVADSRE
ncbi:MAG: hypothetical protein KKC18_10575 [Chloroflexi bacterium]|nr:hypothetical protein [Chloroflexota bacterium]